MSKENVEIVRRLFEAVERRNLAGVLGAYDAEIVIREAESLPYGGEYRGHEGAQKHAFAYLHTWGDLQTIDEQKLDAEFFDAGDSVVVSWRQRAARDGRKFDSPAASVYKLRAGKIVESEMFQDTAAVLRFLEGDKSAVI